VSEQETTHEWAERSVISTSIVALGRFNPAIIHPAWFERFEILPPSDIEGIEPDLRLVSPDISIFQIGWLRVQATIDHFELSTVEEDRVLPLRDVGVNIFTQLLHTPVAAIGINRLAHLPLKQGGTWENLRSELAPPKPWGDDVSDTDLASITVLRDHSPDRASYVRVTVEPSLRIPGGLYIAVNDHHDLASQIREFGEARPAISVLERDWSSALERHVRYTRLVLGLAGQESE
jgi:hypothetical protein